MVKIFNARTNGVNFTKSQIQEKEKELKRDYRSLKEARKQSGAGWDDNKCMIVADADLWKNMTTSWPRIKKFKKGPFPLFNLLGELYDGHTAEGTYNFTSNAEPSQQQDVTQVGNEGEFGAEREEAEEVDAEQSDDELQILDQTDVAQSSARVENEQISQNRTGDGSRKKPQKVTKKAKKSEDAMVGVMEKYIEMKKKQVEDEVPASSAMQDFSISKCIAILHKMENIARDERVRAYEVFKTAENREIFLNSAAEDEETAIMWLRSEMTELPGGCSTSLMTWTRDGRCCCRHVLKKLEGC